jgi:hypothetical protein
MTFPNGCTSMIGDPNPNPIGAGLPAGLSVPEAIVCVSAGFVNEFLVPDLNYPFQI